MAQEEESFPPINGTHGDHVGESVGDKVGDSEGDLDGDFVGFFVGDCDGDSVGLSVGLFVGETVWRTGCASSSAPRLPISGRQSDKLLKKSASRAS